MKTKSEILTYIQSEVVELDSLLQSCLEWYRELNPLDIRERRMIVEVAEQIDDSEYQKVIWNGFKIQASFAGYAD
jgi:hypothetical protein